MLFEQERRLKDDSPIEHVNITYLQLYYSEQDHKLFKELCVKGMMKMYPENYRCANISDFILDLLKNYNS